jgi:hypothetical protein
MRLPLQALASILSLAPISGATFAAILAPNALLAAGVAQAPAADGLDARIADALKKAGANRAEIEKFLARYDAGTDAEKRSAARWLVANMDGHGYAELALVDAKGERIAFEALDHPNLAKAKEALDALERAHPGAEFTKVRFDGDLQFASAEFLSTHLDEAFDAWRTLPWAKSIKFEVFRDFILPYRGSNEPLGLWRAPARARLAALSAANSGESDVRAFGEKVRAEVHPWVGFSDLFYLHPTDQGYDEMCARRLGRCEDITNMISFGMRSVATLCASDYTPWWADRDNNHAWEVVLDSEGRGRAGLSNRCAKVYRKTFAIQPCSLAMQKRDDEKVPRWLSSSHYIDVTDQYLPVTDAAVDLTAAPKGARFAYLAVFNGGQWRPIQWARIDGARAVFPKMGRDICYLPMLHAEGRDLPAGTPFILDRDGRTRPLAGSSMHRDSLMVTSTRPAMPDADTRSTIPSTVVKADAGYELFRWSEGGWKSLGRIEAGMQDHRFENLPDDALYWLVEDNSEKLERIFTIEDGRQVFW